ncbi:hypothetical protein CBR_g2689 [Chara braunii]|uniref:Ubiquitin-like protease family profile domain-containing protein n=1 Tax=Chara braunii TaxID=69332 RepID=A0A388KDJ7_CHABU|nr:hypothetical protein CBR_g2689 [Chara braunii]|eukprot:GBG68138.1 hypothetical protein CBR_g2689 [Chara braunii]
MAASEGAVLSWDLFQGFGAGALRTPFYTELAVEGLVSDREFFDLVEKKDVHLDEPCQISCNLALSQPVQMCTGFESSGAPSEGGDLGSDASFQLHRGEERGRFDDSEEEEDERTGNSPVRGGDRRVLSIPGVEKRTPVQEQPSTSAKGHTMGSGGRPAGVVSGGEEGEQQSSQKRRGDSRGEAAAASKVTNVDPPCRFSPCPALCKRAPIDIDAAYFLEWKDGVRTKQEIPINPSQVVDIGEWEAGYNQRSLDPVQTQLIIDAMTTAYSQAEKTYELPTLKLAPLGLEKPKPWVRALRLKPEDWKDDLADQYYYYFLVIVEDNKKDLKAPPRPQKLSMKDIRWCWKDKGYPRAVMGNPSGKQAQVEAWRRFCIDALQKTPSKSMDLALAEGMVHIWWQASGDVTSISPFGVDPLEAQMKVVELEKAVGITKCHTVVLDLCEPVDITQWIQQAFESLNALLEHLFPSHWTVVAFVRREHDYYFMTSLRNLSVVKAMAGKWVRRLQQKKSFAVGNNLYSLDDRMYILFKGDDLRENTSVVYDTRLGAGDAAAVGAHVKVTPTDLAHLLEFVCKKGEGVMFLGKAHAQVVWEALKGGGNFIALEGNSELLQYTLDFLKSVVNSGAHRCEFISKTDKPKRTWEPSTDMLFKLNERKRDRIYEFLFLETRPRRDSDPEYIRRREHMLVLLDKYHSASRLNAKNFLDRLECLYFVESEQELRVASYSALIDMDEEASTGVVFDTNVPEEDSDTEEIALNYHPAPVLLSPGSSTAGASSSQATPATPVRRSTPGKTPSKLLAKLTPRTVAPPRLRPWSAVPPEHPSRKDDSIHFEGHDHTHSSEADWGLDMIWHPGTIQPAIRKGEWIMVIVDSAGQWEPCSRLPMSEYLQLASSGVADKVASENPHLQATDPAVVNHVDRLFLELQDKGWLELSDEFYDFDTSPSKGSVDWKEQKCRKRVPKRSPLESALRFRPVRRPTTFLCGKGRRRPSETGRLRSSTHGWIERRRLCSAIRTPPVSELARERACSHRSSGGQKMRRVQGQKSCRRESTMSQWKEPNCARGTGGKNGQVEDGQEEQEWEEGGGGAERGERDSILLREGEDNGEHGFSILEDERPDSGEDAGCGELFESFGQLYTMQHGGDDDDAATMEMETQVATGLSADPDAYDMHPLAPAVHLRDGCDEVAMAVSQTKTNLCARARGACGGTFDNAIAPRVLRVMGDISRGLVPPHHVLSTFGDDQVRITAKDLLTILLVDGKLNDEVVNFYMALLGSTACVTRQTSSGLRVFSFSSFFFTKLQLYGHGGVERWAKNVDLLHFNMIFVPVHKDNDHWILFSINFRDNVFEIFDSYPRIIADSRFYLSVFQLIVQYLERHTSHSRSPRSWKSMAGNVVVEGVPRQVDGASCGVFMLTFATLLQHGDRPPFRFSSEDIPVIRRQLAACLLEHHCL